MEIANICTQSKNVYYFLQNIIRLKIGKIFFINKEPLFSQKITKILIIFVILIGVLSVNLSAQAKILDKFDPLLNVKFVKNSELEGQGGPPVNNSSFDFLKLANIFKLLSFNSDQRDEDNQDQGVDNNESQNDFDETATVNKKFIYIVKEGDTLISIAREFGISVNTILWANNIRNPRLIKPGDELIILPVDGVIYTVKNGDTLSSIAKRFKGDVEEIIAFNNLPNDGTILPGQEIVIPDGKLPQISSSRPSYVSPAPQNSSWMQISDGYFVMPTTGRNWGRRHANNGVDISNSCGTPVRAAADGEVIYVSFTSSNWRYANGGYGNNIRILHRNGTITVYAHLLYDSARVKVGDIVNQNQIIALMGGKPGTAGAGNTTGCHLHFEVRGGSNPFVWW